MKLEESYIEVCKELADSLHTFAKDTEEFLDEKIKLDNILGRYDGQSEFGDIQICFTVWKIGRNDSIKIDCNSMDALRNHIIDSLVKRRDEIEDEIKRRQNLIVSLRDNFKDTINKQGELTSKNWKFESADGLDRKAQYRMDMKADSTEGENNITE